MDTHSLPKGIKAKTFCLSLVGEARLWYESSRPIVVDFNGLQAQFRQRYCRRGNAKEQMFHAWRSFHFDRIQKP